MLHRPERKVWQSGSKVCPGSGGVSKPGGGVRPALALVQSDNSMLCTEVSHRIQIVQHSDCRVPVDAAVGDTDAILEAGRTVCRYVLLSLVDVGLDHNTCNGMIAR